MRKIRSISRNLSVKLFTLIIIILYIYPLHTKAQIRTISYIEDINYGGAPRVWDSKTYDDGTVVVRIIGSCDYEMFSLRIINTDGTIVKKDIKLEGVQNFNYCFKYKNNNDIIKYELIRRNQILILYYNATDIDNINIYEGYGIIMDFDGKIYDTTSFGTFKFTDQVEIKLNIDREKGFIVVKYSEDDESTWQQYKVELNGKFIPVDKGRIGNITIDNSVIFSTVDGDYAIAYYEDMTVNNSMVNNYTVNNSRLIDQLTPKGELFVKIIGYDNQNGPTTFLLYQNQFSALEFSSISCGFNYMTIGQTCSLIASGFRNRNFNIKINFLSTGSIVLSNNSRYNFPIIENMTSIVHNLPFGGYLVASGMKTQSFSYIFLFTENGTSISLQSNTVSNYVILPNNTILFSRWFGINNNSWNFDVVDVPKSTSDSGYLNTNIVSTVPKINSLVGLEIDTISIEYNNPISFSDGRLLIYQLLDDQTNLLRQNTSCTDIDSHCYLFEDNKQVLIQILEHTFGIGGNYFIKIENNFVKDINYGEPLLGIGSDIWKFVIVNDKKYDITHSTSGLLRLTVDGTNYFQNLSDVRQNQFLDQLLNEIANTVQIKSSRLSKSDVNQIDPNSRRQLLISINIEETKNPYEKDVNSIISDINTAIKYKDQTPIGIGESTKYLDSTYGFIPAPNYWKQYKFKLLGALLAVIVLVILFFLAKLREKKGRNFTIFKIAIFIFDFIVDILFIINNAKDIPHLYVPSLIFFTLPIGLNIILAFVVISGENMKPEFFQWFTKNFRFASVLTVLSGTNIEILSILESNLAGLKIFQAPFSNSAKSIIFWGGLTNIIIEDIPQVVVQVLYEYYSITYDIIPKLTLYTSVINLTINAIGRLYQVINYIRNRRHTHFFW